MVVGGGLIGQALASGTNSIGMQFVSIVPGQFEMGCGLEESHCGVGERPVHTVTLTRGFQIQTTEVTQGQYQRVMGKNPSRFSSCGLDCPVDKVSWNDAIDFANALSKKEGLEPAYSGVDDGVRWDRAANGYRLPTEAEWEYAAGAGQATLYAGSSEPSEVAWMAANSGERTHSVGGKQSNGWGLYDMSGNVWEWCWDWFGAYTRSSSDPVGAPSGLYRVMRGGSWYVGPERARVVARDRSYGGARYGGIIGFRLVRPGP